MHLIIISLVCFIADLLLAQRPYSCATPEYCNDYVNIDIRIQTNNPQTPTVAPGGDCVPPYVRCTNVKCGFSNVADSGVSGSSTPGAFPWHVFLQDANTAYIAPKYGYIGGGVLIDQYWVLTAAHKVYNYSNINALLGLYNIRDVPNPSAKSTVSGIFIHPAYNRLDLKNDIALLRLVTPVNLGNNVNIACTPQPGTSYVNQNCVVVGFGDTSFHSNDAPYVNLKQAYVPIVSMDTCRNSYNALHIDTAYYLDTINEICAGREGVDACTQDGGSGLVCKETTGTFSIVGLVIWGKNCAQRNVYGVYVNVPNYVNWINLSRSTYLGK